MGTSTNPRAKMGVGDLSGQKRLASDVLGVGKRKIHFDPNRLQDIAQANSRHTIRKLKKDGYIDVHQAKGNSRARVQAMHEAKNKGRHTGLGKRKGTKEARMPTKVVWMRRQRVLRRLLRKYREAGKIDRHLFDAVHREKAEANRTKTLNDQMEVRRVKNKAMRERRAQRVAEKRGAIAEIEKEADKE